MAENIAWGILADVALPIWSLTAVWRNQLSRQGVGRRRIWWWWEAEAGCTMYKREPMTNIKSGWVARWGEGLWNAECPSRYTFDQQGASCQPGCEDTDMPRFNPRPKSSTESSQQRILLRLISVCELILCREWGAQANKQTLHKTAKSLLCEHSLACTVKQWV